MRQRRERRGQKPEDTREGGEDGEGAGGREAGMQEGSVLGSWGRSHAATPCLSPPPNSPSASL